MNEGIEAIRDLMFIKIDKKTNLEYL